MIQDQKEKIGTFIRSIGEVCGLKLSPFTDCERSKYPSFGIDRVGNAEFVQHDNTEKIQLTYLITLYFGFTNKPDFEAVLPCLLCTLMRQDLDRYFGMKTVLLDNKGNRGVMIDDEYVFDKCDRSAQTVQFFIRILDKPCK